MSDDNQNKPLIAVVGSLNMDLVVKTDIIPEEGETVSGEELHYLAGGKGANQAVAAARLGGQTTMIGAVGSDGFGERLLHSLTESGADASQVRILDDTVKVRPPSGSPKEITGLLLFLERMGRLCLRCWKRRIR